MIIDRAEMHERLEIQAIQREKHLGEYLRKKNMISKKGIMKDLQNEELVELTLNCDKHDVTDDPTLILKYGEEIYRKNRHSILNSVPDNWYAVIDVFSGILFACFDPKRLYEHTRSKLKDRLFFSLGRIRIYERQYGTIK